MTTPTVMSHSAAMAGTPRPPSAASRVVVDNSFFIISFSLFLLRGSSGALVVFIV
jgi:hypothetical protein